MDQSSEPTLSELLVLLAKARHDCEEARRVADVADSALSQTPEARTWSEAARTADALADRAETLGRAVRTAAVEAYQAGAGKKPMAGVEIREYTRLVYHVQEAEVWARANAPALFTFDTKAFEKAAASLPGAPITITKEPRATIGSDLSAYLPAIAAARGTP